MMASGSDEVDPALLPPDEGAEARAFSGRHPAGSGAAPISDDEAIPSEVLLGGRSEVRIRHRGEIYRLSLTRAGKLILHK